MENIIGEKTLALSKLLNLNAIEINQIKYNNDSEFEINDKHYFVLTYDEADDKWDSLLSTYLDEVIYSEIPYDLQCYFDEDRWINDARADGRGHMIASYDGIEHSVDVDDTIYYIYRCS